jgi:hypothetical protein
MAKTTDVGSLLQELAIAKSFTPYVEFSERADAINVYFRPDPEYSKRLNDHVTLFLSLSDNRIVGCRIKGISGILEDLPNYLDINHDGVKLSFVFMSFSGGAQDEDARKAINELAKEAGDLVLTQ